MVALEATTDRTGLLLVGDMIGAAANAMLDTMFYKRTGQLDEVAVNIRQEVKLAGVAVGDRIEVLCAPMGLAEASALLV